MQLGYPRQSNRQSERQRYYLFLSRLFRQPHFRYLTAAAVAAQPGLAIPAQIQLTALRGRLRDGELDRLERNRLGNVWVYLDLVISHQAKLSFWIVAAI